MSLVEQWSEAIGVLSFVRPQIEQIIGNNPNTRVFVEYKSEGDKFKYIPGVSEVYNKGNMRILAGIPAYKATEIVLHKINDNKGFILTGVFIGVLGTIFLTQKIKHKQLTQGG